MDEISCCGLNCSKCVSYKGTYSKKAGEIVDAIDNSHMDAWHDKWEKDFSWADFKKGLVWFSKSVSCKGCVECGAVLNCAIRVCCREKKVSNCSKCADFPCENIKNFKEEIGIDVEKNFRE